MANKNALRHLRNRTVVYGGVNAEKKAELKARFVAKLTATPMHRWRVVVDGGVVSSHETRSQARLVASRHRDHGTLARVQDAK